MMERPSLLVVGKDVPRTDAVPKVTGAAQYVADLVVPGMLHAAVLRSPHPNARIVAIDISAASNRVAAACEACHARHRDQDPATKSYRIKPDSLKSPATKPASRLEHQPGGDDQPLQLELRFEVGELGVLALLSIDQAVRELA